MAAERLEVLPLPGESPFHTKGLVYQGAKDFYAQRLDGGLDAFQAALPAHLSEFLFDPRMVAGGWYDVLPIVEISRHAARLAGLTHGDLVRENARWLAQRDARGVYKFLLRLTSPEAVAERLPRLSMRYFDFGGTDGKLIGAKTFESHRTGIPEPLASWMIWAVEGFTPVALGGAGATNVRVRSSIEGRDGEALGIPTVTMRMLITWD